MIRKLSRLLIVTIVALFVWTNGAHAVKLSMDEIKDEVLEVNPDVSFIYIIGNYIYTDASIPLSLADFMLAARTIDVGNDAGNTKNDPIFERMNTLIYDAEFNDDFEVVGFTYSLDLTGKGTPKDEYDISYIDYQPLEEKNTISFNVDGKIDTLRIKEGEKVPEPDRPEKEGAKFLGWYISGTDNLFDFNTVITEDISLEARFEVNKYTVTFNSDGGSAVEAQIVEHGKLVTEPTTPTREGYTFKEWQLDGTKYDFNTGVTKGITLTAVWAINEYTVTFMDGTTKISDVIVNHGDKVIAPEDPTRKGYTFKGWLNGTESFDLNTQITSNMTLTANFEINKYTVDYVFDDDTVYKTEEVEYGTILVEPDSVSKEDYEFLGWYNGEEKYDFKQQVESNLRLVGKYRALVKPEISTTIKDSVKNEQQEFEINIKANDYKDRNVKLVLEFGTLWIVESLKYLDGTNWTNVELWTSEITVPKGNFKLNDMTSKLRITWRWASNSSFKIKLVDADNGKVYSEVQKEIVVANRKYNVTFDNNGETTTSEVVEGAKVEQPTIKEREGYDFIGWYNGDTKFDFETPVYSNLTLTAKYELKKYTVTFNSDGGNDVIAQTVEHGKLVTEPTKPTKTGYTFKEWQLDGAKYNFANQVTGDITLKAIWTINKYTVTFKNGNTVVATNEVEYNKTTTAPASPTKTGYTFDGWYNGDTKFTTDTKITGDVTYTAKFNINTYTVTFKNGNTVVATNEVEYNKTTTAPADLTQTGHTFNGWYNGTTKFLSNSTKVTGDVTYTAKFTPKTYTVIFKNGTTEVAKSIKYNETTTAPASPSKTGHTFDGWYNGDTKFTTDTKITESVTYTARFTPITYTVTFKNGSTVVDTKYVKYNETTTAPADLTQTGYTFNGWYNGTTKFTTDTKITGNVTYTAKFTINKYTVTFKNGDKVTTKTVNYNTTTTAPASPTKTGYTFDGWYNGDTKFVNNSTKVTEAVTYTARFTPNKYIVTFKNGTTVVATNEVEYNKTTTAPADLTKTGYTFNGWYNGDTKFTADTKITGNVTYTAKFTINKYTVKFKNEDTVIETKKVEYNKTTTAPADLTKTGYKFNGWYNGDTKFTTDTVITEDVTYTAKFTIKKYTVTFDSNGGSAVEEQKVNYGNKATKPDDPTRDGYTFKGWQIDGQAFDFETPIESSITLTAKWEKTPIPVTDVNEMEGTYLSEDGKYKFIIKYELPRIRYLMKYIKYDADVIEGTLIVSGSKAYWEDITINFFQGYLMLSLSGDTLKVNPQIAGKYIKQ